MSQNISHNTKASKVSVDELYVSEFQKEGTITAELRMEVTTVSNYPSKVVGSNLEDNLFDNSEFGFTPKIFSNTEKRVTWIDVPTDTTIEQVQQKLDKHPKARLYRMLAYAPITTDQQDYAIREGIRTLDEIAQKQLVRNSDTGKVVLHNNHMQYRRIFLSLDGKVDVDMRTADTPKYIVQEVAETEDVEA